jgi:flagellar biosynthesis/type III secretory pathway ATPase
MNWNKVYDDTVREQIKTYVTARELVKLGNYTWASSKLESSAINASTKKQLRQVLDSNGDELTGRTFGQVDAHLGVILSSLREHDVKGPT